MNEIENFFDRIAEVYGINSKKDYELIKSLLLEIGIKKGDKVLDLGCGKGVISHMLYELSEKKIIAMDISTNMIEIAKSMNIPTDEVEFIKDDFYKTTMKGFDKVVLFDCYPHFIDRQAFKLKMKEVLNDNGYFAIIHDLSRDALTNCHKGLIQISRDLENVDEESQFYSDEFEVVKKKEDDKSYLLLFKKL